MTKINKKRPGLAHLKKISSQNVSKSCPKSSRSTFCSKFVFCNTAQKTLPNIWDTFGSKFVAKNFQKAPN